MDYFLARAFQAHALCRGSLVVLMTYVSRYGRPEIGMAALEAAGIAGMPMSKASYNAALTCCACAGDASAVDHIWQVLSDSGVQPGPEAHAARLRVLWLSHGSGAGYNYFQELVEHQPGMLSRSTFEVAMNYAQRDPNVTYEVLRWILTAMHAHGIRSWMAEVSFFVGCQKCVLTPAEIDECIQLFSTNQQRTGRRPYRRQVFHLLQACRKNKCSQRAVDVWRLCKSMNVEMHSGIAGALLRCCEERKGEGELGQLASEVSDWLKVTWLRLKQIDKAPAALRQAHDNMRATFDLLIQYYAACMRFQEGIATVQVLPCLPSRGPTANPPTLCTMNCLCFCIDCVCSGLGADNLPIDLTETKGMSCSQLLVLLLGPEKRLTC
jgi:hypothetical protein